MNEKYQGLKLIASILSILAWIVGAIGFVSSIFLGIAASATLSKIYMLMGGLLVTSISTCVLLAFSRVISLFIDMENQLAQMMEEMKREAQK